MVRMVNHSSFHHLSHLFVTILSSSPHFTSARNRHLERKPLPATIIQTATVQLRQGKSTREVSRVLGISHEPTVKIRKADKVNMPDQKMGRPTNISKETRREGTYPP